MEFLSNPFLNTVILSILFAVSMKVAHEIGDGRLKFFKGSGIVAGILWGIFASYLILFDNSLANVWMAALAGWILRMKIGHLNMSVGATIMFLAYISNSDVHILFEKNTFLLFFVIMSISGLLHDELHKNNILSRKKSEFMHSLISHTILPLGYGVYSGNWIVFASFFTFMIAYEMTRKYIYIVENKTSKIASHPIRRRTTQLSRKRIF